MSSTQGQKDGRDKYSLRGRVFQSIREDILSGRYEQNTELKEAAIGAELGVSRTPVREALRQLELEGLVTIIPNRGAYVNMITAKDEQDIYVIRSMLEGLCARWATSLLRQNSWILWKKRCVCRNTIPVKRTMKSFMSWTACFMSNSMKQEEAGF